MTTDRRIRIARIVLLAMVVAGCGGGDSDPEPVPDPPYTFEPAPSEDAATRFARERLAQILAGATAPPAVISWESITAGASLPPIRSSAFCGALGVQGMDSALSSILAVGVNALWARLGKRPVSTDTEETLDIVMTFVTTTCPLWDPTVEPVVTPIPIAAWYQNGFVPMLLQPDVAWRWPATGEVTCEGDAPCYGLVIATRDGCSAFLGATIATYDEQGNVLELVSDGEFGSGSGPTTLTFGLTHMAAVDASVTSISCF